MQISKIIEEIKKKYPDEKFTTSSDNQEIDITGITVDSRRVQEGDLFAALPGTLSDGKKYIGQSLMRGAKVILTSPPLDEDHSDCLVILSENPRRLFSLIASCYHPHQPSHIAAVTGTNGKTSVTRICEHIWSEQNLNCASLGTLGTHKAHDNTSEYKPTLTTPDASDLHRQLEELKLSGIDYLSIETSSHGLDQHRVDGLSVQAAAFTNLSRDHLDYHSNLDEYFKAKSRLFSEILSQDGWAVLNKDIKEYKKLEEICKNRNIKIKSYGFSGSDFKINQITPTDTGNKISFSVDNKNYDCDLPLFGEFQAYNAMAALGLATSTGADLEKAILSLNTIPPIHGRLECVGQLPNNASIYVDYAHTPDALETVLKSLRKHSQKKLHLLFGCGGDRDKGKRPLMGEIASRYADIVIVTDDNPRTEPAHLIRQEILKKCPNGVEVADRGDAIWKAIVNLEDNDTLLVAGKGHEPGQIIGTTTYPFDDSEEIKNVIESLRNNKLNQFN